MERQLKLSLHKAAFDVMVTGEKKEEFRDDTKWINSRLNGRVYDTVKFTNGYGSKRPYFICKFLGYSQIQNFKGTYSNGLTVTMEKGYMILLGEIIEKGNIV